MHHKVKQLVFLLLFMMLFTPIKSEKCYKTATHSYELYCDNYSEKSPRDCTKTNMSIVDEHYFDSSANLKIAGCHMDEVLSLMSHETDTLDISNSRYTELTLFKYKYDKLTKLCISNNEIQLIPRTYFHKITKLEEIDVSFNKISHIDKFTFDGALQLSNIHFSNNQIVKIGVDAFSKLSKLEYIDLNNNRITTVNDVFKTNTKLNALLLLGNPINEFTCDFAEIAKRGGFAQFPWDSIPVEYWSRLSCDNGPLRVVSNKTGGLESKNKKSIILHCNANSFKRLVEVIVASFAFQNPAELLKCLPSSIKVLDLSNCFIGQLESKAFSRFVNLRNLNLRNTKLQSFDFTMLDGLKDLVKVDIAHNNLNRIGNMAFLKSLKKLNDLNVGENKLKNALQLIEFMKADTLDLKLGGSYIGKLEPGAFPPSLELKSLYLNDTQLSFDDVSVFDPLENLKILDISSNDLQNARFMKSNVFYNLQVFRAVDCKIRDVSQLMNLFGLSLERLDLSGNYWGEIDSSAFSHYTRLISLSLSNMNLTNFDCKLLKRINHLEELNLSDNLLTKIDLTPLKGDYVATLDLQGNDLTDIIGLNQKLFPMLSKLSILENRLSCDFLKTLDKQLVVWRSVKVIGSLWDQSVDQECPGVNHQKPKRPRKVRIEKIHNTTLIPRDAVTTLSPMPNPESTPASVPWMYIWVGVSILCVVIIIAAVCYVFRKKCFKRKASNHFHGRRISFARGRGFNIEPVPKKLPEIPVSFRASDENHYEEVRVFSNDQYDHLQFAERPKPMPTFRQ